MLDIYDVERIEVLRGPQGTLYGRNTIGGAVKYVTRGSADDPRLTARASYGSYNQVDLVARSAACRSGDMLRVGAAVAQADPRRLRHQPDHRRGAITTRTCSPRAARSSSRPSDDIFIRVAGDQTLDTVEPASRPRACCPMAPTRSTRRRPASTTRARRSGDHNRVETRGLSRNGRDQVCPTR